MWFTRISISNPVFATMMMAAFLVLGLFSYQRLSVDQFPDVNFPVVVVQTAYPGASPESVETDLSRKIEEAVNTISGIKTLSSRSYEGLSVVVAEFDLSVDPALAAQDVRDKVAVVKVGFRKEVKEPRITRFNPDDLPIMSLALRSDTRRLRDVTTPRRPGGQAAHRERARRRANDPGRRGETRNPDFPQTRRNGIAERGHRPGDRRRAQRKPGTAGRSRHFARIRNPGAGARAHRPARAVQPHHRRAAAQPVYLSQVQAQSTARRKRKARHW